MFRKINSEPNRVENGDAEICLRNLNLRAATSDFPSPNIKCPKIECRKSPIRVRIHSKHPIQATQTQEIPASLENDHGDVP